MISFCILPFWLFAHFDATNLCSKCGIKIDSLIRIDSKAELRKEQSLEKL